MSVLEISCRYNLCIKASFCFCYRIMVVSCDGALYFRVTVVHWYFQPFTTAEVALENWFLLVCVNGQRTLNLFLNSPILHIGVGGGKSDSLEDEGLLSWTLTMCVIHLFKYCQQFLLYCSTWFYAYSSP